MIENEIKFVCHSYEKLEQFLTAKYGWMDIRQGYLTPNNRIREITYQNGQMEWVYSFKQRLPNGKNIEIPVEELNKNDFNELWEFSTERLYKRRSSIFISNEFRWDIDFPRWKSGKKYFAMAEVEMPAEMENPPSILPDIEDYIVYEVPRSDNRFSARKLSSEKHAKAMADELGLKYE